MVWAVGSGVITWIGVYMVVAKKRTAKRTGKTVFWCATAAVIMSVCVGIGLELRELYDKQGATTPTNPKKGGDEPNASFFVEEAAIKASLKNALVFEMLTIYVHPEEFETKYRSQLANHWLQVEQGGEEVEKIEGAVKNLLRRGRRYGEDTSLHNIEFRSIRIAGDSAEVKTLEDWDLQVLGKEGRPIPVREGPNPKQAWDITYILKKINGNWLIQKSNSPYKK